MLRHVILFLATVGYAFAQAGNSCTTPLGDAGLCINIKQCDGLVRLLRTQVNNPEVRSYLLRSTCGYAGTIPLVCCPDIKSQFRTSTSTTQRTFTVPPTRVQPVFTQAPTQPTETLTRAPSISDKLRKPYCGFSNDTNTRVVGGVPAKLGEYPWMVALGYRNTKNPNTPRWLCGGTLITDRHVLTAAHCIHNKDVYVARVGELDLYSDEDGATPVNIPIINKKIHEDYSSTIFTNDIAVLTLEFKPDLAYVWPVCLPIDEPWRSNSFEKYTASVSGWGAVYFNGPSSSHLQKAMFPVVNTQQCKDAFTKAKTVIDERVLCAGSTDGKDACQGDSGGPLMLAEVKNDQKHVYQIGVVSYGYRCAEKGYPGVYTRVTQFMDWILRNIE